MTPKNIYRVRGRFLRNVHEAHVRLFHFASTLAMVASRTGRHHIRPHVLAAHMTRDYMIHSQAPIAPAAILAGIIITSEHFTARQFYARPRPVDLALKPNDGWAGNIL